MRCKHRNVEITRLQWKWYAEALLLDLYDLAYRLYRLVIPKVRYW